MFTNIAIITAADAYKQAKTDIFHSKSRDEAIHHLGYGKGYLQAIYDISEPYLLPSERIPTFYLISHHKSELLCEFEKYFKPII